MPTENLFFSCFEQIWIRPFYTSTSSPSAFSWSASLESSLEPCQVESSRVEGSQQARTCFSPSLLLLSSFNWISPELWYVWHSWIMKISAVFCLQRANKFIFMSSKPRFRSSFSRASIKQLKICAPQKVYETRRQDTWKWMRTFVCLSINCFNWYNSCLLIAVHNYAPKNRPFSIHVIVLSSSCVQIWFRSLQSLYY